MKKNISIITLILIAIFFICGCKPPQNQITLNTNLDACVYNPECNEKMALGHRGTGSYNLWATENTLASFEYAWKMGADSIEVDVRKTKDGVLVIMHDATVTKTAYGTGGVEERTLAEVKALKVRSINPDMPRQTIPTFRETLEFLKGKTLVDVDMKTDDMPAIINEIAEARMLDSAYLAGISSVAQAQLARSVNPDIALMPKIASLDQAMDFAENARPVAFFEIEIEDITPELVDYIHSQGIKIHINSLGSNDLLGRAGFKNVLDLGADIIQTDRLDILVPYLNSF